MAQWTELYQAVATQFLVLISRIDVFMGFVGSGEKYSTRAALLLWQYSG